MFRNQSLFLALSLVFFAACKSATATDETTPAEVLASKKARLSFKGPRLYAQDLARALELPRAELCKELGLFDCFELHNVALGGIDPYRRAIYQPLDQTSLSAPIAVDRVALSACTRRARLDAADPEKAVIFRGFDDSITRLYERLLGRAPQASELEQLRAFRDELKNDDGEESWAALSCFAIATSVEALFY